MRCNLKVFVKYWLPPIIYALIIFILSSRPSPRLGPEIPHIDKISHTLIYFIFAILMWRALYHASPAFFQKRAIWFALIFTILFGVSDEWHQFFVSFRHADVFDLLFDSIGASLAIVGINWWNSEQRAEKRHSE